MAPRRTESSSRRSWGRSRPPAQLAPLVEGLALAQRGDGTLVDVEVVGRVRAPEARVAVQPPARVAAAELDQRLDVLLVEEEEPQQLPPGRGAAAAEQPRHERVVGPQPALHARVPALEDVVGDRRQLAAAL